MTIDPAQLAAATWIDAVEHHGELTSTQDRARAAASELPLERSHLVIADRQTAGRGRGANSWWTGEGSLAFSLVFDPARFELPRRAAPQISLTAAVSLIDAVSPMVAGHVLGLHWPNDVYVAGRKLAGVLVDVLPDGRHILGVGVNTNNTLADAPDELRESIATLHWLTGRPVDHGELLAVFLDQFAIAVRMLSQSPSPLGVRFNEICLQHGQVLTVHHGVERTTGRCAGIAPDGALLLDTDSGRRAFYSGTLR
jgi:BirA family transcriptional regulator, biotin operon repressor / biotin---[acetyl-CoA-carboxylase] ligase